MKPNSTKENWSFYHLLTLMSIIRPACKGQLHLYIALGQKIKSKEALN